MAHGATSPSRGAAGRVRAAGFAAVLVAAGLVAIGVGCVSKQLASGNDFPIYVEASRSLLRGESPYDVTSGLHGYVYLPFFALLLAPLALLPLPAGAWIWYALNLGFAAVSFRAAVRAVGAVRDRPLPRWVAPLSVVPLLGFLHDNLALGQANLALLALVTAGIAGGVAGRAEARSGALLGVAAALKMNAAMVLIPFLLRGRWRLAAGFGAGLAAAVLAPLLLFGPARGLEWTHEWREKVVAPAAAGTLQGSKVWDQSPQAALRRYLVDDPAGDRVRVNVASRSAEEFRRVSRAVSWGIAGFYVVIWAIGRRAAGRALLLDCGLACCAMLQVTGFNLKAQFVALLVPALAATADASASGASRASRGALLVAGALLIASVPGLSGRAASNWLLAHSSVTFATAVLAGVLVAQRSRSKKSAPGIGFTR